MRKRERERDRGTNGEKKDRETKGEAEVVVDWSVNAL